MSVERAFAVAAVVVEELDHGDVALADCRATTWRGELNSSFGVILDRLLRFLGFGDGLALFQLRHRFLQHFRMLERDNP